jgi:hypothetical protein
MTQGCCSRYCHVKNSYLYAKFGMYSGMYWCKCMVIQHLLGLPCVGTQVGGNASELCEWLTEAVQVLDHNSSIVARCYGYQPSSPRFTQVLLAISPFQWWFFIRGMGAPSRRHQLLGKFLPRRTRSGEGLGCIYNGTRSGTSSIMLAFCILISGWLAIQNPRYVWWLDAPRINNSGV